MRPVSPPDLGDGRNGAPSELCEADHLVPGVLSGMPRQAGNLRCAVGSPGRSYLYAWYILKRIRMAMGQRDAERRLDGVIEFDDAYFGGPATGKNGALHRKGKGVCGVVPG